MSEMEDGEGGPATDAASEGLAATKVQARQRGRRSRRQRRAKTTAASAAETPASPAGQRMTAEAERMSATRMQARQRGNAARRGRGKAGKAGATTGFLSCFQWLSSLSLCLSFWCCSSHSRGGWRPASAGRSRRSATVTGGGASA